jgi:hypothetical protein
MLLFLNFLAFTILASAQQAKTQIICKGKCEDTAAKCEQIKVKDFTYTRPLGGVGGFAANLNIPGTIREILYNSSERNVTIIYNSAEIGITNSYKSSNIYNTTLLTEVQATSLIDKINSFVCNTPQLGYKGNDVTVYNLRYTTQDNNNGSLLRLTNHIDDERIISLICGISHICK